MNMILENLQLYYGLDWMALLFGLTSTYLVSNKNKYGFLCGILSCFCGFSIAVISQQFGFIAYNALLIGLMGRGFLNWNAEEAQNDTIVEKLQEKIL